MRREEGLEQSVSNIRIYFGRKRIQQSMLKGMAKVMGGKLGECGIHVDIYGEWPLVIFLYL